MYDQYEKIWRKSENNVCLRFVFLEMAAIFDFRSLTKIHITLKPRLRMQTKVAQHRRHTNEETYRRVFSFVAYYIFDLFFLIKNMHNGENAFEVLLYKQCKHHIKYAYSVYNWIHFENMLYMYGMFDHLSTWKCQQQKCIKLNPPEIRPSTPQQVLVMVRV